MKECCERKMYRLVFLMVVASCVLAHAVALAMPTVPADLMRLRVHTIEFKSTNGTWVTFMNKVTELNFVNDDDSVFSLQPQFTGTERVPAGRYVAIRVTFNRFYDIEWNLLDTSGLGPVFYYTSSYNDNEIFSAPGFDDLRKVSSIYQVCADERLVSVEDIPVPFGSVYDSALSAAGFHQVGKKKHFLQIQLPFSFIIPFSGPPSLVQLDFTGTNELIYQDLITTDGALVRVLYPVVPQLAVLGVGPETCDS